MSPRTDVLKFKSGRHLRVRVSLVGAMSIKLYLLDFKEAIASRPVYPPDLENEYGVAIQDSLYEDFRWYYQAIADNLIPPVNADELEPLSRHQFFVCGDPVPHWEDPDTQIPDLSKLEKLLGYSYPEPGSKNLADTSHFEPPSGDYDSYMLAALVVNFPESGLRLAESYDTEFLNKILKDAAHLSDPDRDKKAIAAPTTNFKSNHRFDEDFEGMKDIIQKQLEAIGVQVPEDFNSEAS